jgi:hypothetical protein
MAEVELRAGAHLEFLTKDELADEVSHLKSFFTQLTREQEGETILRAVAPFSTDASGSTAALAAGGGVAYLVPVGFDAFLLRLTIDYEGSNASTPQSCDVRVVADQNTPAGLRALNNSVPTVFSAGRGHAPIFRGGQRVVVCLTGGPVSTNIYCTVQVLLTRRRTIDTDTLESA